MKPKSSIMLYLVLTLIISLGLSAVLPRFAVGYGSFEVFVETDGEMKDFVVFLQFRGTFDATKFNSNQTTEDARYFLGVESGKNGITNEALVNLVLTVSWQRPHSTLHVVFPALTVLVRDPNFNSTIWPSTETSGNLTGLNELRSRLTVWSVSGVLLYSYSNQASVSGGKLKWTDFPQEKNLTEHTLFFVDVLLAALVSSLVVIGIRGTNFTKRNTSDTE